MLPRPPASWVTDSQLSPARLRRRGQSCTDAVLAGFSVGRRAGGVNAHTGAGHEHRLMAIVPAHDVWRLTAHALDLEHLTTTGRIADVQAMHRNPITDRCLHRRPPHRPTPQVCVTPSSSLSASRSRGPGNDYLLLPGAPPGISTRSSTDSDIASAGHIPHRHRPCRFAYWELPGARGEWSQGGLRRRRVRGRAARCRRWSGSGPVIADRGSVRGAGAGPRVRRRRRRDRIPRCAGSNARDRPRPNACRSRTCSPAPVP